MRVQRIQQLGFHLIEVTIVENWLSTLPSSDAPAASGPGADAASFRLSQDQLTCTHAPRALFYYCIITAVFIITVDSYCVFTFTFPIVSLLDPNVYLNILHVHVHYSYRD